MTNKTAQALSHALRLFQDEVSEWSHRNFPKQEPVHPLLGVSEETGELSHAYLKREQGIRGTYGEHTEDMKDAVGDILVYLADFCNRNRLDFADCVKLAWSRVSHRDWVTDPENGMDQDCGGGDNNRPINVTPSPVYSGEGVA